MKRAAKRRETVSPQVVSPQVGVRISRQERLLLDRLIAAAERKAGLAPGTITPASYVKSALVVYMAQQLRELEASGQDVVSTGPTVFDRLRENVALMDEPPSKAKR